MEDGLSVLQVRKLWEALLCSQPEMQSRKGAAPLQALVQARLVGSVTSTKRVAENKRIYDLGSGFIMTKVLLWHQMLGMSTCALPCMPLHNPRRGQRWFHAR